MAGGVGEGAIPLTIGYAAFSHQPQGGLFAEVSKTSGGFKDLHRAVREPFHVGESAK